MIGSQCAMDGCSATLKESRKGYCPRHYLRLWRHGDASMSLRRQPLNAEEFWALVEKSDGCWLWTGQRHRPPRHQYGIVTRSGKKIPAHRWAWILTYGDIPEGKFICHKCDNPPCVRPDHLFLGDAKSNMEDMARKGRNKTHFPVKLTIEQVREIRGLRPSAPIAVLAARYGVSKATITQVVNRKIWKWVD